MDFDIDKVTKEGNVLDNEGNVLDNSFFAEHFIEILTTFIRISEDIEMLPESPENDTFNILDRAMNIVAHNHRN